MPLEATVSLLMVVRVNLMQMDCIPFQDRCQDTASLTNFCLPFDSTLIICWILHPGCLLVVVIHGHLTTDPLGLCHILQRRQLPGRRWVSAHLWPPCPGKNLTLSLDPGSLLSSVTVIVGLAVSPWAYVDGNLAACASFRTWKILIPLAPQSSNSQSDSQNPHQSQPALLKQWSQYHPCTGRSEHYSSMLMKFWALQTLAFCLLCLHAWIYKMTTFKSRCCFFLKNEAQNTIIDLATIITLCTWTLKSNLHQTGAVLEKYLPSASCRYLQLISGSCLDYIVRMQTDGAYKRPVLESIWKA